MKLTLFIFFYFTYSLAFSQTPTLYLVDMNRISKIKEKVLGSKVLQADVKQLTKNADKVFTQKFGSVMDKTIAPPCGNMHEYFSLAKYFWYDSSKPDGKPYIRRDGEKNPEADKISDDKNFDNLIGAVRNLSWAYYFTNEEKYAEKATQLIHFWFIDTATRMLPNLNHGQMTIGKDTGRGSGIIDTHNLPWVIDAVSLIRSSNSWKKEDELQMKHWFNDYLQWLITSKNGIKESKVGNNHKTFYENQVAVIALYCGKDDIAMKVFENATKLIAHQIEPDGKQPEELVRTLALHYSIFNLEALFYLSNVAEKKGIDLWHFETKDGRSIRKAIDYLVPYVIENKKWEYPQIKPIKPADFYSLLLQAAIKYNDNNYKELAQKIKETSKNTLVKMLYE